MLPIDGYNLSDAFYHKLSLNVLKKSRYIKVKKRYFLSWLITQQGRRRFKKSGTAIERHRRSARAEGSSGREHERGLYPLS